MASAPWDPAKINTIGLLFLKPKVDLAFSRLVDKSSFLTGLPVKTILFFSRLVSNASAGKPVAIFLARLASIRLATPKTVSES